MSAWVRSRLPWQSAQRKPASQGTEPRFARYHLRQAASRSFLTYTESARGPRRAGMATCRVLMSCFGRGDMPGASRIARGRAMEESADDTRVAMLADRSALSVRESGCRQFLSNRQGLPSLVTFARRCLAEPQSLIHVVVEFTDIADDGHPIRQIWNFRHNRSAADIVAVPPNDLKRTVPIAVTARRLGRSS